MHSGHSCCILESIESGGSLKESWPTQGEAVQSGLRTRIAILSVMVLRKEGIDAEVVVWDVVRVSYWPGGGSDCQRGGDVVQ